MNATPPITLLDAVADPNLFGRWFRDRTTWAAWRAFIASLFALPLSGAEAEIYRTCTGRGELPTQPFREAWLVIGRRGGKSFILALVAVYLAAFVKYAQQLAPGERATVLVIAADRKQARVIMRYCKGLISEVPMLARLIERETEEAIDLSNRVTIEVATASFRTVRGYTIAAALCDEIAFWRSEESANPDTEVLDAIRPGLATIPTSMLLCASSSYARRGALYEAFRRHYGQDDDRVLVWRAPTHVMNPSLPPTVIDEAYNRDPASAAAEYGAEFRSDLEDYLSRDALMACVAASVRERAPDLQHRYIGFVDPSGAIADSFALAIAHQEGPRGNETVLLDVVREIRPPFSPEATVSEYSELLKRYRISKVWGDRYAGEWPREQFRKEGIHYEPAERNRSELYLDLLPIVTSRQVVLLENDRLITQLSSLERHVGRSHDAIDHRPGAHDDLANAAAGAIVRARKGWSARAREDHHQPRVVLAYAEAKIMTQRRGLLGRKWERGR